MRTIKELFDLTGKVALLTASSKGMGYAMAEALAEQGAKVVVSGRRVEGAQEAADAINTKFGEGSAMALPCNVGYKDQLQKLVDDTRAALGKIDILVCNAGVNPFYGPMSEIPDEAFDKTMNSNVRSTHWLCQMVLPDMIESNKGSVILMSSAGAWSASDTLGTYNVSKLAEVALMRNLAMENGPHGIRVNAICPSVIKTNFAKALWDNPEAEKMATRDIPLRKFGEPDDLKGLALFLASEASGHITGQAMTVCGGRNMWS